MSYSVDTTRRFDKALKKCIKRGLDMSKFKECVRILSEKGALPVYYRPHKLSGKFKGVWSVISSRIGYWYGNKMIAN